MKGIRTIQGRVTGNNQLRFEGRNVLCWTNAMQAAVAPQPLDLSQHLEKIVEVSGLLLGDLWEARFERVVLESGWQEIRGEVVGFNTVQGPEGPVKCYRHGMLEAWYMPLNLSEYMGRIVTVAGDHLQGYTLYKADVVHVEIPAVGGNPDKEASSLNDLMQIRSSNREQIEAVNGNLGTALGYKWSNGERTEHPAVIIFVPQKTALELIPEAERAPAWLEAPDGTWCLTDVVTGGKAESLEAMDPLPPLSDDNKRIVDELKSGRVGLIGGIQLAFYLDGIAESSRSMVGTAGIAVLDSASGEVGFLTNQHVADAPGRRIYHPWHEHFRIGRTRRTIEFATDQHWYEGIVDEADSYVRCDCGFVALDDVVTDLLRPGLHVIGATGALLRTDPDTMDVIGQRVISLGRTRGVQRGTVVAYSYEYVDDDYSLYTDFLIIGEDGKAFSYKGDSGKVIVTDDDEHRPLALLWGGWQERLRSGREQENWTYAIDLGKVLQRLGLELLE